MASWLFATKLPYNGSMGVYFPSEVDMMQVYTDPMFFSHRILSNCQINLIFSYIADISFLYNEIPGMSLWEWHGVECDVEILFSFRTLSSHGRLLLILGTIAQSYSCVEPSLAFATGRTSTYQRIT